jgi:hypothetical protein
MEDGTKKSNNKLVTWGLYLIVIGIVIFILPTLLNTLHARITRMRTAAMAQEYDYTCWTKH